jgi:hypothetical protein
METGEAICPPCAGTVARSRSACSRTQNRTQTHRHTTHQGEFSLHQVRATKPTTQTHNTQSEIHRSTPPQPQTNKTKQAHSSAPPLHCSQTKHTMNQLTQAPKQGYAADVIAPKVEFSGRDYKNKDLGCLALFLVSMFAGIVVMGIVGTSGTPIDTTGGTVSYGAAMDAEISACQSSGARLLQADFSKPAGMWILMGNYPQVPAVMLLLVPVIAVLWIFLLIVAARQVVWSLVILDAATYLVCGVFVMIVISDIGAGADPTASYLLMGYGAFLLIVCYVTRKHITKAGDHLSMATKALWAPGNKHVFAAAAVSEVLLLVFMAISAVSIINCGFVFEVNQITCSPQPAAWAQKAMYFLTFNMYWMVAFFKMAQLQSTAMATAAWFFNQQESWAAFKGLKLALTRSSGTLALSSLVAAITDTIVWEANKRLWWMNPVDCFLKLLLACFRTLIMSLTRFCVIAHSLTGLQFTESSGKAFGVLKRNFVGGFITSRTGTVSLNAAAYLISLAIGFASWAWFDASTGTPTLQLVSDLFLKNGNSMMVFAFAGLIYLYLALVRRPMMTILLLILISQSITALVSPDVVEEISTPFASLFIAAIANIMLTFQARVILGAMETMFMCHAIAKEGGAPKRDDIDYELLEDKDIVLATPVTMDHGNGNLYAQA